MYEFNINSNFTLQIIKNDNFLKEVKGNYEFEFFEFE